MPQKTSKKLLVTHCNKCRVVTNHTSLFSKSIKEEHIELLDDYTEEVIYISYEDHMVIQCNGCDTVSFLTRQSGDHLHPGGDYGYMDINYPEAKTDSYNFLTEQDKMEFPGIIQELYRQLTIAFQNDANVLAGIGLRILVEAICLQENIEGSNLKLKIENLHERGLISKNEVPILDKLRSIGNSSAHEIKVFHLEQLYYALDIINHILKSIYVLPKINKRIKVTDLPKSKKASRLNASPNTGEQKLDLLK